jgi:hypothetical protein
MRLSRFLVWSALAGAVVPIALEVLWWVTNRSQALSLEARIALEKVTLVLWPTSFGMFAATSDRTLAISLLVLTTVGNVVLYSAIGVALWYGVARRKVYLIVPIAALSTIWWWLLSMP